MANSFSGKFTVSGYREGAAELLTLRNRNRLQPRTGDYLDWRYLGLGAARPPLLFWVQGQNRARIGVAGVIFRPYWVDGRRRELGVLGDISLDREYRGSGLAREWFRFIQGYLAGERIPGLVIPTPGAGKLLAASGWEKRERIVPYVYLLNPSAKLYSLVKSKRAAQFLGNLYALIKGAGLARRNNSPFAIEEGELFAGACAIRWRGSDMNSTVVLDKGGRYLQWRYGNHPDRGYRVTKFSQNKRLVGLVVHALSPEKGTGIIHDLFVAEEESLPAMMIQFVSYQQKTNRLAALRCPLNQNHNYASFLARAGFAARPGGGDFFTFSAEGDFFPPSCRWLVTAGDKDV